MNHASVEPRLRLPRQPSAPPTARPSGLPMYPWSKTQICPFRGSLAASDSKHDCMAQFLVVEALDSPQQVSGQDGPLARGLDALSVGPNSSHAVGCSLRRFPVCSDVPGFSCLCSLGWLSRIWTQNQWRLLRETSHCHLRSIT